MIGSSQTASGHAGDALREMMRLAIEQSLKRTKPPS